MRDKFDNAEKILDQIEGGSFSGAPSSSVSKRENTKDVVRTVLSSKTDKISIESLYIGHNDLKYEMEQRFAKDVVTRTVFDLFGTGEWIDFNQNVNGHSLGNKNIFDYKKQLVENLYEEIEGKSAPELRLDMSPQEYSGTINKALEDYRNYLSTHENAGDKFSDYAILLNFDDLLKTRAPFITFNEDLQYDAIDKYLYKGPNVKHYTGFTSSEFAEIENQESDLAKVLLNIIPEIGEDGAPINGSFIGLSGFNSAMTSLKRTLLWSPWAFSKDQLDSYYNGVDVDLNGLISSYIKELQNPRTSLPEDHRSFLIGKLKGIQKYIYNSNIEQDIKNMFTQMFFKTEAIQYRAYSYDQEANGIKGSNLKETLSNSQRYQLEDAIRGAVRLLNTNDGIKRELRDTYNLNIQDGQFTLSNGTNNMIITYSNKNNKFDFQVDGLYTDEFAERAISDFLSIVIPDTYKQVGLQINGKKFRLTKDFATPLGLVLLASYTDNLGLRWRNKQQYILDLSGYKVPLTEPAKKLSVIYGADTRNVVKSPSGNNLPLYQLTNLTYNVASIVHDSYGEDSVYKNHLFVTNPGTLVTPQVRNEVLIGNTSKSPAQLSVKELLQLSTLEDFYKPLVTDGIIYLQNATFADKSTHYLIGYDSNKINVNGKSLQSLLKTVTEGNGNPSDSIIEFTRKQRKNRIDAIAANIISDYKKVFLTTVLPDGRLGFTNGTNGVKSTWNGSFSTLKDIDEFLKNATVDGHPITIEDLRALFANSKQNVAFQEEIHAYKPLISSRGKARINETLLNYQDVLSSSAKWKERVDNARQSFINSINDNDWTWNRFDGGRMKEIWDNYQSKLPKGWFEPNTGTMWLYNGDKLHPILEAFFEADLLLSNEYNSLTIGEVFAHPNKNKNDTNLEELGNYNPFKESGTYEEFSEANRLIAQIKRSVAFGATYHPFAQNMNNGVNSEIQIAVMEDMPAYVCTPNGYEDGKLDSMDGSGLADALEARFENNSLLDARVGDNKKTIMMDVDKRYGKPILLKWAVYALTNEVRRNGRNSIASAEKLCEKMRSNNIGLIQDLTNYYNERVDKIIFEDFNFGTHYKILNVGLDENGYFREIVELGDNGIEIGIPYIEHLSQQYTGNQETLYAIDQLFGGAWTCEYDASEGWKYNEASTDMLEYILSKDEMQDVKKRAFIAYAVNKSAIKVGAGNVNPKSTFIDNNPLFTVPMRTKYGGVQMDADHELDESEVTEMTQMISSLMEDGHYTGLVSQIYSDLGRVVAKHMEKYKIPIEVLNSNESDSDKEVAKNKLHQLLGQSLVEAFSTGSKDTIGLAQAFLNKAADAIKHQKEFHIPFSAATINGSFISDVASSINRGGIRHKYEGLAGVLNPSYNMVQFYKVWNKNTKRFENRMFPQLAQLMREYGLNNINDLTDIQLIYSLDFDEFGVDRNNPFIKEINHWSDLQFEDTVIINGTAKYLRTFEDLDSAKEYMRNNPVSVVGLHTGRPRNLRGVETRFTANGHEYSYYDLDSVRTVFYINAFNKLLEDKKDPRLAWKNLTPYQQSLLLSKGITETASKQQLDDAIIQANTITQQTLKAIEEGTEFTDLGGIPIIATSWYTRPAEIIMGRYQMDKFGLNLNDNIYDVKDPSFFRNKLENKYNLPDKNKVPNELYDIILYNGNEKFYIKLFKDPNEILSKYNISDNPKFTVNGDSVWYNDENIANSKGKQFKSFLNDYGEEYNLIVIDSIESYNNLIDSNIFDQIQVLNYTPENFDLLKQIRFENNAFADLHLDSINYWNTTELSISDATIDNLKLDWEIRKRKMISDKASNMFDSFGRSLNLIGARIPTQAMQSFQPLEVVAFTESDTNQIYVPPAQTSLQGSDFDIDKEYIMAYSVDDNGVISIGSRLQNLLGLNVVSKLISPTNVTYQEGPNGILVDYDQVKGIIGINQMSDQDVVDVLNQIYLGNGFVTFIGVPETTQGVRQKEKFLKLVNLHSNSKRDVKGNALKNRIVSAINTITLAPQNQLIAQIPVNMDEPKAAAALSKLGKAEMHINSDNPETKFMMQVQNMVGKEVIGISAVSLKAFFALTYVYNQKVQVLKDAVVSRSNQEILNKFADLLFINPLTDEITSLSNIDLEQLYDIGIPEVLDVTGLFVDPKLNEWLSEDLTQFNFRNAVDDIIKRVNKTDSALTISAIISAATDNAKELLLAKINATSDLVDIYTYLTAIGVPFKDIANVMVNDTLQFISKLGESNVFDKSSSNYDVKDMLRYYVGQKVPKGVQRDVVINYLTLKGNIGSTNIKTETLLKLLADKNIVNNALSKLYSSLHRYESYSGRDLDQALEDYYAMKDMGMIRENERDINLEPYSVVELRNAIKFLELTKKIITFRENSKNFDTIQRLVKILDNVEEMSNLGRTLGINQGMPTNLYSIRNDINNLNDYITERTGFMFNFDKFITDETYRTNVINSYKAETFNLPGVLSTVPHFWQMLQTLHYAKELLTKFSIKNRSVYNLANEIESNSKSYKMSESEFKSLQNYVNDVLIASFLKDSEFEVFISPEVKLITSIAADKNYSLETRKLRLDSSVNVAAFKNWMDTYVIPLIIKRHAGNAFVDNLRPLANATVKNKKIQETTGWKFPFNLTDADKSPTTQQLYGNILRGFNELVNQDSGLFGQSIGNLFYVYNMIVNKDSFGQTSFTKLFTDVVQNDENSIVNKFNMYVSQLDEDPNSTIQVSESEAKRRIVKDNPDSRLNANPGINYGPDFVLDLEEFYHMPNTNVISPELFTKPEVSVPKYQYTLDPQTIVVELTKQLNNRLQDSQIHIITDDELVDFKNRSQYNDIINSKGFVLDGEIYINISRAKGATLLHEFAHLVLAGMKYNPETRQMYYQLVTSVKGLSDFEEKSKLYPNHIGSDLYEEVFASKVEEILDNKEYLPSDYSNDQDTNATLYGLNLNNKDGILQALTYLFGLPEPITKLEDIVDKPIDEIINRFGYNMLNSSVPISKTSILNSQKQNTVKQELFENNKLNMKCDE